MFWGQLQALVEKWQVKDVRYRCCHAKTRKNLFWGTETSDNLSTPTRLTGLLMSTEGDAISSLSAHKMYGPKGIGALYICRDLQCRIESLIYGGGQQNNLRAGTIPAPLCVGMGTAAKIMKSKKTEIERVSA